MMIWWRDSQSRVLLDFALLTSFLFPIWIQHSTFLILVIYKHSEQQRIFIKTKLVNKEVLNIIACHFINADSNSYKIDSPFRIQTPLS